MDRAVPTVIVVIVVLGVFALMWRSWRARSARDAGLEAGYPAPTRETGTLASAKTLYVATTPRDAPLERLAIRGLGFRARAELTVTGDGIRIAIAGADPVFVPAAAIELLTPATWAIDRVVESGGLVRLGWRLNPRGVATDAAPVPVPGLAVDSYFRIIDPDDRDRIDDAIRSIAAGAAGPTARDESEA